MDQYLPARPEKQEMYQELSSSLGKDREGVMALVNRALWQQAPAKPPELH
jgi:hypothetical protein